MLDVAELYIFTKRGTGNGNYEPQKRMTTRVRDVTDLILSLPNDHPLQIIIRTYPLALSLSLGPALLSFLASSRSRSIGLASGLKSILLRELALTSFPFAITVAIGGGSGLQFLWKRLERKWTKDPQGSGEGNTSGLLAVLEPWQRTFVCNALASLTAITLLQARHHTSQTRKVDIPFPCAAPIAQTREIKRSRSSETLDLTLLVLVRAVDALSQRLVFKRAGYEKKQARKRRLSITTKLDALAFWASSAGFASPLYYHTTSLTVNRRIMWCFFYEPDRCVLLVLHVPIERRTDFFEGYLVPMLGGRAFTNYAPLLSLPTNHP